MTVKIAEDPGVSLSDVALMEGRLSGMDMSLNAPQSSNAEGREWIGLWKDDGPGAKEQVGHSHDQARVREWLGQALGALSGRERFIVAARHLGDAPRTLEAPGSEMGLSKERIRQLEAAAYARMKRALTGQAGALEVVLNRTHDPLGGRGGVELGRGGAYP